MKVIEPGEKQPGPNQTRCADCRCLFEVSRADFKSDPWPVSQGRLMGMLHCPNCKQLISVYVEASSAMDQAPVGAAPPSVAVGDEVVPATG